MPDKLTKLTSIIQEKRKLAVAYSGGIDSTLLLSIAIEVLGVDNVAAFFLNSVLQSSATVADSIKRIENEFEQGLFFEQLQISPLKWDLFAKNCENRCYYCKKQMYKILSSHAQNLGFATLADGTNADDLLENRPGIKAIRELGVFTPLEKAGFTKEEIRREAKRRNLSNYDLTSNSCLATRVDKSLNITEQYLKLVEQAEGFMYGLGFKGCRVRVGGQYTIIEIEEKDFSKILINKTKQVIESQFHLFGLQKPCLLLKGR